MLTLGDGRIEAEAKEGRYKNGACMSCAHDRYFSRLVVTYLLDPDRGGENV